MKLNWVSRAAIKVIAAFLKELPNKFPLIALAIVFRNIQTNLLHRVSIFRFTFSKCLPRNWTGDGEIWTEICETWSRELEIYSWKFPSISDFEWSWCTRNHQESFPTSFKIHEKIGFFFGLKFFTNTCEEKIDVGKVFFVLWTDEWQQKGRWILQDLNYTI